VASSKKIQRSRIRCIGGFDAVPRRISHRGHNLVGSDRSFHISNMLMKLDILSSNAWAALTRLPRPATSTLGFVAGLGLLACAQRATRSARVDALTEGMTDSVVLERTRCLGSCPAYRLRVSRAGEVLFVSHNPGEQGVSAVDTVEAWVSDSISKDASRLGLFSLPDSITPGALNCRNNVLTDHPTITIGVFGRRTKRVVYYTGCVMSRESSIAAALQEMRQLASRVDTLTRAVRWIRPARMR